MKNIAVFASGNGTNLQAIIDRIRRGALRCRLALVVSDKPDAFALKRARKAGVRALYLDPKKFASREDYEKALYEILKKEKVELVVLAGFMRIVGPYLIGKFKNRILNIHPALLPAFRGTDAIQRATQYGVKVTGVTVHLVDEKVDHGPIILQEPVRVLDSDTAGTLEERIHAAEHRTYSRAIAAVLSQNFVVKNRKISRRRQAAGS